MSSQQTAKTQFAVSRIGTKYAYRRIGTSSGAPLLLLTHFRGVMDTWDPAVVNSLAARRPVILFDYAGAGHSTGEVATTVRQSAADVIEFLGLVGETDVDILGFSLGGMVAQLVALNADPQSLRVRKLILAGTGTSAGPGVTASPNQDVGEHAGAANPTVDTFKVLFFPKTRAGNIAADAWWDRIHERTAITSGEEPTTLLSTGYVDGGKGIQAQVAQLTSFANPETSQGEEGAFARLPGLKIPILVANGKVSLMWIRCGMSTGQTADEHSTGRLHDTDGDQFRDSASRSQRPASRVS
jgi:pimeloyl-ACP methyl ester carboxylesterase